jgi:hypothetical protein
LAHKNILFDFQVFIFTLANIFLPIFIQNTCVHKHELFFLFLFFQPNRSFLKAQFLFLKKKHLFVLLTYFFKYFKFLLLVFILHKHELFFLFLKNCSTRHTQLAGSSEPSYHGKSNLATFGKVVLDSIRLSPLPSLFLDELACWDGSSARDCWNWIDKTTIISLMCLVSQSSIEPNALNSFSCGLYLGSTCRDLALIPSCYELVFESR